jgi:hypothetical protein
MRTHEQHSSSKLAAIVISVLVIAGVVVIADHLKKESGQALTTPSSSITATTPAPASVPSPASSAPAANTPQPTTAAASYTASSNYYVPHGNEQITVHVTLQSGTITDVSIQNSEGDRDSQQYQEDFAAAYKSYVVGKKISGLSLSTVAGASDTTQGFNDALRQISSQAQA